MALEGLEPARLWHHFEALSSIPRCSGDTAAVQAHLEAWARGLGLVALRDAKGNLVVHKKASKGRENRDTIVLQAHVDMVCEQNADRGHDFTCDPLELVVENGWVKARDTTLGADNGIGVATIQALLEDTSLVHGPLEAIFTIDEETDMGGASHLDVSLITGRTILNLDGEGEGSFVVGSAGSYFSEGTLPVTVAPPDAPAGWKVEFKGLTGGHSGVQIHEQRGNAITLAARFAAEFLAALAGVWQLASLEGGDKFNAIPREASIVLVGPADGSALQVAVEKAVAVYAGELGPEGSALVANIASVAVGAVLSPASQQALLDLLTTLPDGVLGRSKVAVGLVETSNNVARVRLDDGQVQLTLMPRSSSIGALEELTRAISAVFRLAGGSVAHRDYTAPWSPAAQSHLREVAPRVWKKLYGTPSELVLVHAGLECSFFAEKFPGVDMISTGPLLVDLHTPRERVGVASVGRFHRFVVALLEEL